MPRHLAFFFVVSSVAASLEALVFLVVVPPVAASLEALAFLVLTRSHPLVFPVVVLARPP